MRLSAQEGTEPGVRAADRIAQHQARDQEKRSEGVKERKGRCWLRLCGKETGEEEEQEEMAWKSTWT